MKKVFNNDIKEKSKSKPLKVIPTPRIKFKHKDITDKELGLLMEYQTKSQYVSIYTEGIHC